MSVRSMIQGCWRYQRSISLLAADVLASPHDRARVGRHLDRCPVCRRRFEELRWLAAVGGSMDHLPPPAVPSPFLEARWSRRVRLEDGGVRPVPGRCGWGRGGEVRRGAVALGAIWLLILFFRVTTPGGGETSPEPRPVTWKEVRMVLVPGTGTPHWMPNERRLPDPAGRPRGGGTAPRSDGLGGDGGQSHGRAL